MHNKDLKEQWQCVNSENTPPAFGCLIEPTADSVAAFSANLSSISATQSQSLQLVYCWMQLRISNCITKAERHESDYKHEEKSKQN